MSLDWSTLAFQTVNVAVLIWLLSRLLWRPLAEAIAARRAETARVMAEAAEAKAAAEALRADLTAEREKIAEERQAALKAAAEAGEAERARILAAAREEAARAEAAAKARIAAERAAAETALYAHAADLAAEMAARLGREMEGPALRAAALDGLAAKLGALPEADRAALAADGGLTVSTASPLPPEEAEAARARLEGALGAAAPIAFRAEPELVAGVEISGAHLTLSNSWRDGLARMRKEIARDG